MNTYLKIVATLFFVHYSCDSESSDNSVQGSQDLGCLWSIFTQCTHKYVCVHVCLTHPQLPNPSS